MIETYVMYAIELYRNTMKTSNRYTETYQIWHCCGSVNTTSKKPEPISLYYIDIYMGMDCWNVHSNSLGPDRV